MLNNKKVATPFSLKLSHERWLVLGLSITALVILALSTALTQSLGWSKLATATLLFFLTYPLIWLASSCYHFWRQAIMQLTTYTQIIREGETNLRFRAQHQDNLLAGLQKEISALALGNEKKRTTKPNTRKCT
jgi:hypothetical protein